VKLESINSVVRLHDSATRVEKLCAEICEMQRALMLTMSSERALEQQRVKVIPESIIADELIVVKYEVLHGS
jgi:hypothetical protein